MLTTSAKEPSHTLPAQDDVTNAPSLIDTRVYLRDINDGSIGIFVIYWYHPPNYWDYLAFSEKLNLRIMAEFEAEQIPFARPALAIHMVEPGHPNRGRRKPRKAAERRGRIVRVRWPFRAIGWQGRPGRTNLRDRPCAEMG